MKFVHIGLAKTGTTWLQEVVFPEWMEDNDVAYFYKMRSVDFAQPPQDKILLSNEAFTARSILYDHDTEISMQHMVNLFGDVKVIITNREANSLIESLYVDSALNGKPRVRMDLIRLLWKIGCIYYFLDEHEIEFIELYTDDGFDYDALAKFMGIRPPTDEQRDKWNVRVNKRRGRLVMFIVGVCNRYGLDRIRKIIIRLTA